MHLVCGPIADSQHTQQRHRQGPLCLQATHPHHPCCVCPPATSPATRRGLAAGDRACARKEPPSARGGSLTDARKPLQLSCGEVHRWRLKDPVLHAAMTAATRKRDYLCGKSCGRPPTPLDRTRVSQERAPRAHPAGSTLTRSVRELGVRWDALAERRRTEFRLRRAAQGRHRVDDPV